MTATLMPEGKQSFSNSSGAPLVGGKLYTYDAGTSTPRPTYQDAAGVTPNANPIILDARGEATVFWNGVYKVILKDASDVTIWTVDNVTDSGSPLNTFITNLAGSTGSSLVGFLQSGAGAVLSDVQTQIRQLEFTPQQFYLISDGNDWAPAIMRAWAAMTDGSKLFFPSRTSYPINSTLNFFGKGRVQIDFNGQLIDASGFSGSVKNGMTFKGISQSRIGGIFIIGNKTFVSSCVEFAADALNPTIHSYFGKIHASGGNIGVFVGDEAGYQFSDCTFEDIYGADCNIGICLTGVNTLAMQYNRLAAYNNTNIGVFFKEGSGVVGTLLVAASGTDVYFGATDGTNHNKLNRWDILAGYSEEGVNGEVFIGSAACTDGNFFHEQIIINGVRCTPFSSTNVEDFVKWNLNGDLIFRDCTFTHGTQLPNMKMDASGLYRSPRIVMDECVIDCAPTTAVQVPLGYHQTTSKQQTEMDVQINNGLSFWNNNGAINEGLIKRGFYTSKIRDFEVFLRSISGLHSAWTLRDLTSGSCVNSVLGKPAMDVSATVERRDVWPDDGLYGFFKNSTTSKTATASSADYPAQDYTFGCFLRPVGSGTDETQYTNLGGVGGIRLGIGFTGSAFVRCQVGGFNAQAVPSSPFDAHLVIGRYTSSTSVKVNAINLRTGEVVSAAVGGPLFSDLVWTTTATIRNDRAVRGFPFIYNRALTDNETNAILQSAMLLTDSWRL